MFIEPKKAVTVDELLRGMIVQSGNDASIALAEVVAGSEDAFAERMNREAARLGLANTHFSNATGLSHPQHYSTATDLGRLAAALIRDFPDDYKLYSLREYRYNNITQPNRNRLLWIDPFVDGMKTGHTDAAGWCLIASAKRGERRLIAVVLGAASDAARAAEAQKLLNYGFQNFDLVQLYASGKPVSSLRVWKGEANDVAAGFSVDRFVTLPKGKAEKLALTMTATEPLVAPVTKGQAVGTVKVSLEGAPVAEFPLVALADVPSGKRLRPRLGHCPPVVQVMPRRARQTETRENAMIVYLNGKFLPIEDAKVSVLDRGFIYGDGVYELIPVYRRQPFRLPQHLARLQHSLDGIRLANPHTDAEWTSIVGEIIARQPFDNQGVYFQVTRGVAKRDHTFPKDVPATVFMMSNPLATPSAEQIERGVAVVTAEDNRWQRCDLKTISLVGNVLMRQLAADADAVETVMFRDGHLTEASASNVLVVIGGAIVAPPKDRLILPGITYGATWEFAREAGIPFEIRPVGEGRGARRRRDVAHVVDEGSARRDHARRQAVRGRQAGAALPEDARALPGEEARSSAAQAADWRTGRAACTRDPRILGYPDGCVVPKRP